MKSNFLSVKKILILSLILILVLVGFSLGTLPKKLDPIVPDSIYYNGKIITMDSESSIAEAVAVKDGKIVSVGTNKEINRLKGRHTETVNLNNKVMLPGFIDTHSHIPGSGTAKLFKADLQGPPVGTVENIDDLIAGLREQGRSKSEGEWIQGEGYDQTLLAEQRHPTKEDLDQVSTSQPIWIKHANGHMGVANSKALELAGINKNTPDPQGAEIVRDPETGEPTGLLKEPNAMQLVTNLIPPLTVEQKAAAAKKTMDIYTAAGVTTSVIAHGTKETMVDLQNWRRKNILPIRITSMQSGELPTFAQKGGILTGFGNEWIKVGAYGESVYDGSIQGYSGYLKEPYYKFLEGANYPEDYRGYPNYSKEELFSRVRKLYQQGYQIAIHGNGDQAIEDILDAYEAAQEEFGKRDARLRIEHAQMATEDQLRRMKELGVSPSFFVSHTFYWGDQHREIFMGPERAANISPLKTATELGIRYSVHLDSPVVPMSPLQAVWSGVNRLTRSGKVLGPDQRVDPMTALRAVTIDAAWQNFEEDIKGSIEEGKFADFVILEEDPLTIDPINIKDIKVLETIVNGKTVYKSEK